MKIVVKEVSKEPTKAELNHADDEGVFLLNSTKGSTEILLAYLVKSLNELDDEKEELAQQLEELEKQVARHTHDKSGKAVEPL